MALVDALETQLAASRATAANLLSALVAELTGSRPSANDAVPSQPGATPQVATHTNSQSAEGAIHRCDSVGDSMMMDDAA